MVLVAGSYRREGACPLPICWVHRRRTEKPVGRGFIPRYREAAHKMPPYGSTLIAIANRRIPYSSPSPGGSELEGGGIHSHLLRLWRKLGFAVEKDYT